MQGFWARSFRSCSTGRCWSSDLTDMGSMSTPVSPIRRRAPGPRPGALVHLQPPHAGGAALAQSAIIAVQRVTRAAGLRLTVPRAAAAAAHARGRCRRNCPGRARCRPRRVSRRVDFKPARAAAAPGRAGLTARSILRRAASCASANGQQRGAATTAITPSTVPDADPPRRDDRSLSGVTTTSLSRPSLAIYTPQAHARTGSPTQQQLGSLPQPPRGTGIVSPTRGSHRVSRVQRG